MQVLVFGMGADCTISWEENNKWHELEVRGPHLWVIGAGAPHRLEWHHEALRIVFYVEPAFVSTSSGIEIKSSVLLPMSVVAKCDAHIPQSLSEFEAKTLRIDLDQHNVEKVRTGETLKAYPIGRFVDPNDPNVMHESHVVYRKESGASWNLSPLSVPHAETIADSSRQAWPTFREARGEDTTFAGSTFDDALTV